MARIVYAWELGGGFGHIHAFLPVALSLKAQGHTVTFIVRDLLHAEHELNRHGFRSLQAPLWQGRLVGLPEPSLNMAEILLHQGFLREEHLSGLVKAWLALLQMLDADLVIADYGPAALIAARAAAIPAATFGTGFCRPPPGYPSPNLQPWVEADEHRLANSEDRVVQTVNAVLATFSAGSIGQVADIFNLQEDFLCTYQELDPYPNRPPGGYRGAVYNLEQGEDLAWSGRDPFRVFCYLKPTLPGLKEVITQLQALRKHEVVLFCPGLADSIIARYATPRLAIIPRPARLDRLTTDCHLVLCQAGHGMVAGMLRAGIPLLLFPTNLEQYLTSRRVEDLGAGLMLDTSEGRPDCRSPLERLLREEAFRSAARGFALKYAEWTQDGIRQSIEQRILELCAAPLARGDAREAPLLTNRAHPSKWRTQ